MQNDRAQALENKANADITLATCLQDAKTLLEQKNFDDFDRIKRVVICLNLVVVKQPEADLYRQTIFKQLIAAHEDNRCPYPDQSRDFLCSQIKNISYEKVIKSINAEALVKRCFDLIENNQTEDISVFLRLLNLKQKDNLQNDKLSLLNQYLQGHLDFINNYHQQATERYQEIINQAQSCGDDVEIIKLRILSHIKRIAIFDFAKHYADQKSTGTEKSHEYNKARKEEYKQASELDKKYRLNLFEVFNQRQMKIECHVVYFYKPTKSKVSLPSPQVYRYAERIQRLIERFESIDSEAKNSNQQLEECLLLCKSCMAVWKEEPDIYFISAMLKLLQYDNQFIHQQAGIRADLETYEKLTKNSIGNQFISLLAALEAKGIEEDNVDLIRNLNIIFIKQSSIDHVMQYHTCSLVRYIFLRKILMFCHQLLGRQNMQGPSVWPNEDNYNQLSHYLFKLGEKLKTERSDIAILLLNAALWNEKLGFLDNRLTYQSLLPHHAFLSAYYFDYTVLALAECDVPLVEYYFPLLLDKLFSHFNAFTHYCNAVNKKTRNDFKMLLAAKSAGEIRHMLLQMDGKKNFNADFDLHFLAFNSKIINFFVRQFILACDERFKQDLTQAEMHYKEILPYCKEASCPGLQSEIETRLKKIEQLKIAKPEISPDLLFNQLLTAFANNAIHEAEAQYLKLSGLVKAVLVDKKYRTMLNLEQMLDQLDLVLEDRQFCKVEEQLKIYFSKFDYADFTQHGRDRLLGFLKLFYEKKLLAHAGKLRSNPDSKKEDILTCYQKITLPELKIIATTKIEKLLAPPPQVSLIPEPHIENKPVILAKEKKISLKPKKKRSPRFFSLPLIQAAVTVPEEVEEKIEDKAEAKINKTIMRPEKIPFPQNVIDLLKLLQTNALQGRAYVVGGFVGELLNPVGKKTDIDLVFGADPKFVLHLLQKTYPDAIVEQKDKRLFKVIFPSQNDQVKSSLDIWWSAPLSNPNLSNEEALKVDTFGGEWASEQEQLKARLTKEDIEETPGRDFTANSLYGDAECQLFDPTGRGYTDLMNKPSRLKCIIKIEKSFGKDAARTLRAILFAAKRNSPISDEMIAKIRALTLARLHEEKPFRVNILLKKLLTQGEAARNFYLLRAVGLLDKIYPDLANFLKENKHPLVIKFVYNSLKAIDDLYFYSLIQEQKKPKNPLIWPSLSRIYLIWIRATEIMRKCKPSIYHHDYARVHFDAPVIQDAIRLNPFFNEQFMQLGALINTKLVNELTQITEKKDEVMLRKLISEEQAQAQHLEINKQLNKLINKEDKQVIRRVTEKIQSRFVVEQNRLDRLDFDGLIKVRNEQIVILVERFRNKLRSHIQSVRLDWEMNFNHRTELNAPVHNALLVTGMYRQRLLNRLESKDDLLGNDNTRISLHHSSLVRKRRS